MITTTKLEMNRPIKFRVWEGKTKEMSTGMPLAMLSVWIHGKYPNLGDEIYLQFTGILDKNGVEIFESDVLKRLGEVIWGKYGDGEYVDHIECWMVGNLPISDADTDLYGHGSHVLEVIGNVWENPELLSEPK